MTVYMVGDGTAIFLGADSEMVVSAGRTLFSFGGGDWVDGSEATEIMDDVNGRWLAMNITDTNQRLILDRKHVVGPFEQLDILNKPVSLQQMWQAFEKVGEVTVKLSHHTIKREEDTLRVSNNSPLVFAFSRPPKGGEKGVEKKPKKPKKNGDKKNKKSKKEVDNDDAEASAALTKPRLIRKRVTCDMSCVEPAHCMA